jgi:cytidylate kinase
MLIYAISGPKGGGKSFFARLLAGPLNVVNLHPDHETERTLALLVQQLKVKVVGYSRVAVDGVFKKSHVDFLRANFPGYVTHLHVGAADYDSMTPQELELAIAADYACIWDHPHG